jgi:hypothetical protein
MHRGEEKMTEDEANKRHTLYNIASVKAYNYCEEYNIATGRVEERGGARLLKEGYMAGFLAGFAHRLTGGNDE